MDVTTHDHAAFSPCCPVNGQTSRAALGDALPVRQTPQFSQACLHGRNLLVEGVGWCWGIISHRRYLPGDDVGHLVPTPQPFSECPTIHTLAQTGQDGRHSPLPRSLRRWLWRQGPLVRQESHRHPALYHQPLDGPASGSPPRRQRPGVSWPSLVEYTPKPPPCVKASETLD